MKIAQKIFENKDKIVPKKKYQKRKSKTLNKGQKKHKSGINDQKDSVIDFAKNAQNLKNLKNAFNPHYEREEQLFKTINQEGSKYNEVLDESLQEIPQSQQQNSDNVYKVSSQDKDELKKRRRTKRNQNQKTDKVLKNNPKDNNEKGSSLKTIKASLVKGKLEHTFVNLKQKFELKNELKENDEDLKHLSSLIEEYFQLDFSAFEIMQSGITKIIKQLNTLFLNQTRSQYEYHNTLQINIQRCIRDIKKKVINYCLDNSDYLKDHTFQELSKHQDEQKQEMKKERSNLNKDISEIMDQHPESYIEENSFQNISIRSQNPCQTTINSHPINSITNSLVSELTIDISGQKSQKSRKKKYLKGAPVQNPRSQKQICQKFAEKIYQKSRNKEFTEQQAKEVAEKFESELRFCYPKMGTTYTQHIKTLYLIIKNEKISLELLLNLQKIKQFEFIKRIKNIEKQLFMEASHYQNQKHQKKELEIRKLEAIEQKLSTK